MSIQKIASRLVELCREGQFMQAYDELFADNAKAIEPKGANMPGEVQGLENLREKSRQFEQGIESIHGMEVSDPLIADDFFSVRLVMDVTMKGMERMKMEEICVYEVQNGKIVKEQFFYTPQMAEA